MKRSIAFLLCITALLLSLPLGAVPVSAQMVSEIPNAQNVPAPKEKQALIYEENFDSDELNASLTGNELLAALGWSGALGVNDTMSLIANGEGRAVSITAGTTRMDTVCLLRNNLLAGGDYILEYTVHLIGNTRSDPERTFGFCSESATTFDTNTNTAWRYAMKENGTSDHHLKINANKVADGGNSLPISANDGVSSSLVGSTYRTRIVVDADFGVSVYLLEGDSATLISATSDAYSTTWQQTSETISGELRFHILSGITVAFDDIQVWTCKIVNEKIPTYLGYQISTPRTENTAHDMRFLLGCKDPENTVAGMEITYICKAVDGEPLTETRTVYAGAAYSTISTDFGKGSLTAPADTPYILSVELLEVPSRMTVDYRLRPFVEVEKDGSTVREYGNTQRFTLDRGLSAAIPAFPGQTLAATVKFDNDYYRQYYTGTTAESYRQFISALTEKGYTVYSENTLDGNLYTTLNSELLSLHVYYIANKQTTSVLVTYKELWIPYHTAAYGDTAVTKPSLALMNMDYGYDATSQTYTGHNNGMGFVYTLEDGSYVIIDGGYAAEADDLYNYLVENNKRADGKILIRAWIMTHPDGDHIGCFIRFSTNYSHLVTLEYFVAQADPSHASVWSTTKSCVSDYTGCRLLIPLAGQSMYFGSLRLDFFFTAEMYHCLGTPGTNESSLAFKGILDGTSVFFAGDIVYGSIDLVAAYYGASLKSDALQLPHHGLDGTKAFYKDILPETIFFCTHAQAMDQRWNKYYYGYKTGLRDLKALGCVKNVYTADGGIQVFSMSALASATE